MGANSLPHKFTQGDDTAPDVLLADAARIPLRRGFDTLADLLALTLGPLQGGIVASRDVGASLEFLSDSATIARRFLALPNRAESAGAMLLRNLVWRLHQTVGDGCATAAVLTRTLAHEAQRYRAAGVNAAALRQGIEQATAVVLHALQQMSHPLAGEAAMQRMATAGAGDPRLGALLAEIFDLLGPEAQIDIKEYVAPYLEREYHAGGRWQARLASPYLISDIARQRAVLHDCAVAVYSGEISAMAAMLPLLESLAQQNQRRLLLAARAIRADALATLVVNHQRGQIEVAAVELQRVGDRLGDDCDDLAALTGARVYHALTDSPAAIAAEGLGRSRRVEADANELVVVGGGNGPALRAQIEGLRLRLDATDRADRDQRAELETRLARLAGTAVTLQIGTTHQVERETLRRHAERGVQTLRHALREGVVPGGGVAYLQCIEAVRQLRCPGDTAYGRDALAAALEAPFRQIVANARCREPSATLAAIRRRGPGWGYDALNDTIVEVEAAHILDATIVLSEALRAAVSGATMLITTDALILKRNPEMSMEP